MRSFWITRIGPSSEDKCFCQKMEQMSEEEAQTQKRNQVKREAEIRTMLQQAVECLMPPDVGRCKEGFSP
jgi:hypothetical protein